MTSDVPHGKPAPLARFLRADAPPDFDLARDLVDLAPLPEIPGGWTEAAIDCGPRVLHLVRPAVPDAFLDLPEVHEANARDDYMPYWSYLWPAAQPMARRILETRWEPGTPTLELGCGLGLTGLAALAAGLDLVVTDYDVGTVRLALHNARRNGLPDPVGLRLDWRSPPPLAFPLILGCEIVYEVQSHAPILALLDRMLLPGGRCWIADPGRVNGGIFVDTARTAGWNLALSDRHGHPAARMEAGEFRLIEMRRTSDK